MSHKTMLLGLFGVTFVAAAVLVFRFEGTTAAQFIGNGPATRPATRRARQPLPELVYRSAGVVGAVPTRADANKPAQALVLDSPAIDRRVNRGGELLLR